MTKLKQRLRHPQRTILKNLESVSTKEGFCTLTTEALMRHTGLSRNQIKTNMSWLCKKNILTKHILSVSNFGDAKLYYQINPNFLSKGASNGL